MQLFSHAGAHHRPLDMITRFTSLNQHCHRIICVYMTCIVENHDVFVTKKERLHQLSNALHTVPLFYVEENGMQESAQLPVFSFVFLIQLGNETKPALLLSCCAWIVS